MTGACSATPMPVLDRRAFLQYAVSRRCEGKKIVFTNGCFDVLHPGHLALLEAAGNEGDVLLVGINSDQSVRRLKGDARPIFPEGARASHIAALRPVDAVTLFDEETPEVLIGSLLPDVLVKGGDYGKDQIVGAGAVEKAGGRVVIIPLVGGWSTTSILAALRESS